MPGTTLVVAQSGGPTAVMNASLAGVVEAVRADARTLRILGSRFGIEGVLREEYVDVSSLTAAELGVLHRTPGASLGSSRYRPTDDEIAVLVPMLASRGIGWLVMVGGNDTAETLHRVHRAARRLGSDLQVAGIPKTIDNDLPGMDHCPGYGSAARYLALAAREAGIDSAAMQRTDPIKIVEVMGRNAGWLAAASALGREQPSDAPQLIFLPERPRPLVQMLDEIQAAYEAHGWVVVVLSENQRDAEGRPLVGTSPVYTDPHGHPYYESPGGHLARVVQAELGLRARYERPGSLQRTSFLTISETDAAEAREAGAEAARRALAGTSDVMIAIQRRPGATYAITLDTLPLEEVAHQERRLPDAFIAPAGTDVTDAFLSYARPLIGSQLPSIGRVDR